jgi:hypothetical protein
VFFVDKKLFVFMGLYRIRDFDFILRPMKFQSLEINQSKNLLLLTVNTEEARSVFYFFKQMLLQLPCRNDLE